MTPVPIDAINCKCEICGEHYWLTKLRNPVCKSALCEECFSSDNGKEHKEWIFGLGLFLLAGFVILTWPVAAAFIAAKIMQG